MAFMPIMKTSKQFTGPTGMSINKDYSLVEGVMQKQKSIYYQIIQMPYFWATCGETL